MNRFIVHLDNCDDLFVSAGLSGNEPDLLDQIAKRLRQRHGSALEGLRVVRAIKL